MKLDFSRSVLIIVDVQNDFCPEGALGVREGDQVIEPLNRLSSLFASHGGRVLATQDWHPAKHASFASTQKKNVGETVDIGEVNSQVLWPDHCVQGTKGAEFHEKLDQTSFNLIIRKGFRPNLDSYSAFFENDRKTATGLGGFLKAFSIDTLVIGGLATDYCVLYTAIDATTLGYKTIVVKDAIRGVDLPAGSVEQALMLFRGAGVTLASSGDIQ